ncbi:general substrate transporter [Limtongia smithiae]|uniref:general substrate transporter n=1 Tax=Limtongia smithiae TaxID=1125753 RepID=UPI0034CD391C
MPDTLPEKSATALEMPAADLALDEVDGEEAIGDIESGRPNPFLFLLTILVSFSGFLFGYDTGYISGALVAMGNDLGHEITSGEKEFITSATSLGALLGGIIAGTLADELGRKWVTLGANSLFVVGAAVQTSAHTVWVMVGGRFIMGWGVGIASLIAPLYIGEMAPARFRGRLVILNVLAITGGQVIAYAIGAGLENIDGGWRILVGLGIIPAVVQMVMFVFMPETPRYLVRKGKVADAVRVVRWIYQPRHGAAPSELLVQRKIELLEAHAEADAAATANMGMVQRLRRTLGLLYGVPANFRAVVIACGLQGIQQFCGFNSLMYFSSTIFETVGFDHSTAVSLIVAGTNMAFTVLAFMLIDVIGRRRILLWSIPGMSGALVLNAIAFHFLPDNATQNDPWAIVILVAMMLYVAFYAAGIGNVPWQQAELFPMSVRGIGTSMATATNWAGNLVIGSTYLTMMSNITATGTFAFYAALCAVGVAFVFFVYPETANLTLEDIHELLTNGFGIKQSQVLSKEARRKQKEERRRATVREKKQNTGRLE